MSYDKKSLNSIATASFDKLIKLYDVSKLSLKQTLKGHEKGVWTCHFKPNDSNVLASGANDSKIFIWDLNSNKPANQISFHNQTVYILIIKDL
jgi:F-box and WD-40 domain protein CDC4